MPTAPACLASLAWCAASVKPSQTTEEMTGSLPFSSSATMRVTSGAFLGIKCEHFARVAIGHHRNDAVVRGQPRGELRSAGSSMRLSLVNGVEIAGIMPR